MSETGRYRKIYTRLWRHPGFSALSDAEKTLTIYLLTGPQTNRLGLYVFSLAQAAEDLGTLPQTLSKRFGNVCQTFGWPFAKGSRVLFIPSWFKWNPPENANVVKGSLKDLNEIPPCALLDAFARNIETLPVTLRETFIEGLRQRLPKGMPNQDQYPDQEQKQEQDPRAARGSERGAGSQGVPSQRDKQLLEIARRTLKLTNPNEPLDNLVDAFHLSAGLEKTQPKFTKADAIAAINAALVEHRRNIA